MAITASRCCTASSRTQRPPTGKQQLRALSNTRRSVPRINEYARSFQSSFAALCASAHQRETQPNVASSRASVPLRSVRTRRTRSGSSARTYQHILKRPGSSWTSAQPTYSARAYCDQVRWLQSNVSNDPRALAFKRNSCASTRRSSPDPTRARECSLAHARPADA